MKEYIELIEKVAPLLIGSGGVVGGGLIAYFKHRKVKELEKDKAQDDQIAVLSNQMKQNKAINEVTLKEVRKTGALQISMQKDIEYLKNSTEELKKNTLSTMLKDQLLKATGKAATSYIQEKKFELNRTGEEVLISGKNILIDFVYRSFIGNGSFDHETEIQAIRTNLKQLIATNYSDETLIRFKNKNIYKHEVLSFVSKIKGEKDINKITTVTTEFMLLSFNYFNLSIKNPS